MAAIIRSYRNGITPLDGVSRDDLVIGDIVLLGAVDAHTTYNWIFAFAPEGSTATFSGDPLSSSPGVFTVDVEGPYLIKLVVDAGEATEDTQYVRLRAKTAFGQLCLVAAGERRDEGGTIPVDVDVEGWANEQNANLVTLKDFIKPLVSSGRLLYVDANDGTSNYADHSSIQDAITAATTAGATASEQWVVAVRPGVYVEDVIFAPYVHVVGWPGVSDGRTSEVVILRTSSAVGHEASIGSGRTLLSGLHLEGTTIATNAVLRKTGSGILRMHRCRVEQQGVSPTQGAAVDLQGGTLRTEFTNLVSVAGNPSDRVALFQSGSGSTLICVDTDIRGPSGVDLNPGLTTTVSAEFDRCRVSTFDNAGWGIRSSAQTFTLERSNIDVPLAALGSSVLIHPSGGALVGNIDATVRWSTIDGDINFEITGVAGTTTLNLSGVEYRDLVFPGGDPTQNALVKSKTHFYDNSITGLLAENVQDAIDEVAAVAAVAPVVYHNNIPSIPNDTVRYRGWAPIACELIFVRVYIQDKGSSAGTYTLSITNEATGNTVLAVDPYNMYGVFNATVTPVALTGVSADLTFAAQDAWTIELTSDDPGFDADSVYVSLVFNTATAGGPVVEDLATTLVAGNVTGGTDIVVSPSDEITGVDAAPASGNPGTDLVLRGGLGDGAGADGVVRVEGKLTVTGLIDPTGMVFDHAVPADLAEISALVASDPTKGAVFISDGSGLLANRPYYWPGDETFNDVLWLVGGDVVTSSFAAGGSATLRKNVRLADITVTTAGVLTVILPSAAEMQGVTLYVLHNSASDPGSTLTIDPDGADTIDGSATYDVGLGNIVGMISDGGTDWKLLALGGGGSTALSITDRQNNVPPLPNNTFRQDGWATADAEVTAIRVYAEVPHTVGSYTATFTNEATGQTMLAGANYNMGLLAPATVTTLALTAVPADLTFSSGDRWSVEFTSDNPGFDGSGIYFDIVWNNVTSGISLTDRQKNVPTLPGNTYRYDGWASVGGVRIAAIRVLMRTVNTVGNYTVIFTNETTGQTLLSTASFDMNTLAPNTVTSLPLTGALADLTFSAGDRWSAQFISDNVGFDGAGVYFGITWDDVGGATALTVPEDDRTFEMAVSPGNTVNTLFFAPYGLTVTAIKVYCQSGATTAGVYTLEVDDVDNSNNLLGAATFDMTTPNLPAATLTTVPLTGTTANLDLAAGTRVRFRLVSDNGDLVADGVYIQLIFRGQ